jgi:hypothetical protein
LTSSTCYGARNFLRPRVWRGHPGNCVPTSLDGPAAAVPTNGARSRCQVKGRRRESVSRWYGTATSPYWRCPDSSSRASEWERTRSSAAAVQTQTVPPRACEPASERAHARTQKDWWASFGTRASLHYWRRLRPDFKFDLDGWPRTTIPVAPRHQTNQSCGEIEPYRTYAPDRLYYSIDHKVVMGHRHY